MPTLYEEYIEAGIVPILTSFKIIGTSHPSPTGEKGKTTKSNFGIHAVRQSHSSVRNYRFDSAMEFDFGRPGLPCFPFPITLK